MKGLGKKALIAVTSGVVTLLLLEVGVRLTVRDPIDCAITHPWDAKGDSALHVRSPDRTMVYELRPNANVFVERFGQTYITNSAGFRDAEFEVVKPADVYRIVAIGDSITFGWSQSAAETWPKVLEQRFKEAGGYQGRRVEVFNMAIAGYNTEQEVELLKTRALRYHPDLIVIGYCLNDKEIGIDNGLWDHFTATPSALYNLVQNRVSRIAQQRRNDVIPTAFATLGAVSRDHKTPILVAFFPLLNWTPDGNYPARQLHASLAETARGNGLEVLDLTDPLIKAGLSTVKDGNDEVHPNSAGLRVAAEAIQGYLAHR